MEAVLFEDHKWMNFLPLVYTRPVGELRIGIFTIAEKWSRALNMNVAHNSRQEMRGLFSFPSEKEQILINARCLPTPALTESILKLLPGEAIKKGDTIIASYPKNSEDTSYSNAKEWELECYILNQIPDIFTLNHVALELDAVAWARTETHTVVSDSNKIIGDASKVLVAAGAKAEGCTFNTTNGPIIIDKDAEVMEGALIRGPFCLGEHSQIKMGAKIYGATTIGPHCKVGGEVSNSVIMGYSNKAHDGFLGNSVLGEWCNLGADTNNSNLKNNYSRVKIWNYESRDFVDTGLTFCGLIMGDHAKSGINTMFNTGTVVGPFANVFGGGFPPKYIPAFAWGGADGFENYDFQKAMQTAERVFARRSISLTKEYQELYANIIEKAI
ncbi:MAG: GlmU family protein [Flavobacteriales bacterium]|jgi:UDP-N-acetylglucosamine diphosphorylase/glucosamine-1-phosphate N-acetyltransferase